MSEIELKFLIDEAAARQLWRRARAAGLLIGRPVTRTLRSIYLDTGEHALRQAGIERILSRPAPPGRGAARRHEGAA